MTTKRKKEAAQPEQNEVEQLEQDEETKGVNPFESGLIQTINFFTGIKGGVGKSTCCRIGYQYHLDHNLPVVGIEGNPRNPDFSKFYPEIKEAGNIVKFTSDPDDIANVNLILKVANKERKNLVVNMPADCEEEFSLWLESFSVIEVAEKINYKLINWFVTSGEPDSVESLKLSLKKFGFGILHVVVQNKKFRDWSYFEADKELKELLEHYNPAVISIPGLNTLVTGTILNKRLSYGAAREYLDENFDIAEQGAVASFLNQSYRAIEQTPFFPVEKQAGPPND